MLATKLLERKVARKMRKRKLCAGPQHTTINMMCKERCNGKLNVRKF